MTPAFPPPPLAPGTVHVWIASLDLTDDGLAPLVPLLAKEERARAARFRLPRDRRRSLVSRAVLRQVLGAYTGLPPAELCFAYGERGKPALAAAPVSSLPPLAFNLSHSSGLAAVAVTHEPRIGIDIEQIRPVPGAARILARYFSPAEREALEAAPPEERQKAFLRAWTAKEAFLKAVGTGFFSPLSRIPLPATGPLRPCHTQISEPGCPPVPWTFLPIALDAGSLGTVAVEGQCSTVELFRCTGSP